MGGVNDLVVCNPLNARKKKRHIFQIIFQIFQNVMGLSTLFLFQAFQGLISPCRPAIPHLGRSPGAVAGEGRIRRGGEAQAPAAVQRALCTLRGPEPGAAVPGPWNTAGEWMTNPAPTQKHCIDYIYVQ